MVAPRRYNPPRFMPGQAYDSNPRFRKFIQRVGKGLEELRKSQGWSQAELSRMLGNTGNRNLGYIERAEKPGVSLATVYLIADALGYDVEIKYTRRRESHGADGGPRAAEADRGTDIPEGDQIANVVLLRPVQPHPIRGARDR